MASAIGTTKPDGIFGALLRSRIARIIFIWNFAGLAFLVVGVLLLSEMRAGLTDAQYGKMAKTYAKLKDPVAVLFCLAPQNSSKGLSVKTRGHLTAR